MTLTKEVVEFANALHIQDDTHLNKIIEESREIAERVEAGDDSLHYVLDILIGAIEAYEDDNFKFPAVSPEEMMYLLIQDTLQLKSSIGS